MKMEERNEYQFHISSKNNNDIVITKLVGNKIKIICVVSFQKYEGTFGVQELINISPYFKQSHTIEQIQHYLNGIIEKQQIKIIHNGSALSLVFMLINKDQICIPLIKLENPQFNYNQFQQPLPITSTTSSISSSNNFIMQNIYNPQNDINLSNAYYNPQPQQNYSYKPILNPNPNKNITLSNNFINTSSLVDTNTINNNTSINIDDLINDGKPIEVPVKPQIQPKQPQPQPLPQTVKIQKKLSGIIPNPIIKNSFSTEISYNNKKESLKKEEEILKLKNEAELLKEQNEVYKTDHSSLTEENKNLKNTNDYYKDQLTNLEKSYQILQKQKEELQIKNQKIEEEKKALIEENNNLKNQVSSISKDVEAIDNQNNEIRKMYEDLEKEKLYYKSQYEDITKEKELLQEQVDELSNNFTLINNELENIKNENNLFKKNLEEQQKNNINEEEINGLIEENILYRQKIEENEILKKEIEDLKNQLQKAKEKNEDTNNEKERQEQESENENEEKEVKGEIIHDMKELEMLTKKINTDNNKKIIINLLYKASVDSDKAAVFHEKCDSAQSTIVLVETKDGKRFGGFTTCSWSGQCVDKNDPKAFIFSFDKMKTYDNIPGDEAIGCYPKFGPIFLGCQIKIFDDAFTKGGTTFEKELNFNTEEDYELTGGQRYFGIKDIEVYEVLIE